MTEYQVLKEEQLVETRLIEQLQELGYTYFEGEELNEERISQTEVVLQSRFIHALKKLNPWLDENNVNKVAGQITHMDATSLMDANQQFHELLLNKVSIQQDLGSGRKSQLVQLIDFDNLENNEFIVTNQLSYTYAKKTIQPDLLIYVNGLPLVVIACKSPTLPPDQQITQGVKQLQRYQKDVERLFHYNQFLIATSKDRAKVGTIDTDKQRYASWKEPYPLTVEELEVHKTPQDLLITGILDRGRLLDIIQHFIVYETESGRVSKKVARYQQYRAVNKATKRIIDGDNPQARGGVIWETYGSGKSLSLIFLAKKLQKIQKVKNAVLVVVTDNKRLHERMTTAFIHSGFIGLQQISSVDELKSHLMNNNSGSIQITMDIFQSAEKEEYPIISNSENVIVLVDEIHHSLALHMRTGLPNAAFVGFTGSPITQEDKSTVETCGTYIDKYPIEKAVHDEVTVPIFYEQRLEDLHVQGKTSDILFDRLSRPYSKDDQEKIKQKYVTKEALIASSIRVKRVVEDIIHHYREHIRPNGFKAQIVCASREAASTYKKWLDKLSDYSSAVIFSNGESDQEVIERYKKPLDEDLLAFLIVCDSLESGFDAPIEQVIYTDKPLKEHTLLQVIARTNRPYDKKTYGLVVDYYGFTSKLEEALNTFHPEDIQGVINPIDEEIPRLQYRHRRVMQFFDHVDTSDMEKCLLVIEPEDVRHSFDTAFKTFSESMDRVLSSLKANSYIEDLKWLGKIRKMAKDQYYVYDGTMDISDCSEKVRELIEAHIYASTPDILMAPVHLLTNQYEERLDAIKSTEARAIGMKHAIKHEIRVKMEGNPVQYNSLQERLEEIVEKRNARQLTTEEMVEDLSELRNLMMEMEGERESIALPDSRQLPFFQLLQQFLPDYVEQESIEDLTEIIIDIIQENVVIGWTEKIDVKREIRKKIKKQLRASSIKNAHVDIATRQLLELSEIHYK